MPRNVQVHPSRGPRPALWYYSKDVAVVRVIWNGLWISLAKRTPWFRLKNFMLRRTGMKLGKGVAVGYAAQPDVLFPQDIHLHDDVTIGYKTTILCHGYLRDRYERGPVVVEQGASIGADCTILAGVRIGKNAIVSAKSLVNKDIPAGEMWGGVPVRRIRGAGDLARSASE